MAGVTFHPAVTDHGMLGSSGNHLAFEQLAAPLAHDKTRPPLVKYIGIGAPLGGQQHFHARPHLYSIAFRFPQRLVILPGYFPVTGRRIGTSMAVFATVSPFADTYFHRHNRPP